MAQKPLQPITPFLWFDGKAEEAMNFYVSIFPNSRTVGVTRYGEAGPGPKGSVMTAAFVLNGQQFTALNGGPTLTFTPAISFVVHCDTQAEVDGYWAKLTAGGQEGQCGWLTDRFGVSWQVVPNALVRMLQDPDRERSKRVVAALMPMKKLDVAALERAYDQP
ncbi:MAG TPA: VOC family protein [Vicinamibacterales bacterium]|nr:VOC family protein [Vicinamibacterales bacterium]